MASVALKKISLLFIFFISASLVFTSCAGVTRKFMGVPAERVVVTKGMPSGSFQGEEEAGIHHRNLRVRTNDYGSHDPTPSLEKPPAKPTPN